MSTLALSAYDGRFLGGLDLGSFQTTFCTTDYRTTRYEEFKCFSLIHSKGDACSKCRGTETVERERMCKWLSAGEIVLLLIGRACDGRSVCRKEER